MAQPDMAGVYLQFVIQQITSRGHSIHEKNLMSCIIPTQTRVGDINDVSLTWPGGQAGAEAAG